MNSHLTRTVFCCMATVLSVLAFTASAMATTASKMPTSEVHALSSSCPGFAEAQASTAAGHPAGWSCFVPEEASVRPGVSEASTPAMSGSAQTIEPLVSYNWKWSKIAAYGVGEIEIGTVLVEFKINMNGKEVQHHAMMAETSGPAIRQVLHAYCRRTSDKADCGDVEKDAGHYDSEKWSTKFSFWPWKGTSHYKTHFYPFVYALGWKDPSTTKGWFPLPETISPRYECNSNCVFN